MPSPAPAAPAQPAANIPGENATIQEIFGTQERPGLDRILELVADLGGITGCAALLGRDIKFGGTVPADFNARAFRDTVWTTFQSVADLALRANLGGPASITIDAGTHTATLFTAGDAALLAFHTVREFQPGVREKLHATVREMARML
jgi:hypothetical protein